MYRDNNNPFSVTKASDYTDEQIAKYWVNFLGKEGQQLNYLLNPQEIVPKYIIGSKGCGKTHLIRYFDFPIQRVRHNDDLVKIIDSERYIGLYFILSSLNSSRFTRESLRLERRQVLFEYYLEIFLSIQLLKILEELFRSLKIEEEVESAFCLDVLNLFSCKLDFKEYSIKELVRFLTSLQKRIDYEVNNADLILFENNLNNHVEVLVSRGDLIFGIPKAFVRYLPHAYSDLKFIYILDEYEKLSENQKEYINTLVWEKQTPSTFWIGSRKYGFKNTSTYLGEKIRESSEYERVTLDEIFREQEKRYKTFCNELFLTRLERIRGRSGFNKNNDYFELFEEDDVVSKIKSKYINKVFPHERSLRSNLKSLSDLVKKDPKVNLGVGSESDIDVVVNNLKSEISPLHEKYNYFLLYQDWSKRKNLIDSSFFIKNEYENYLKKQGDSRHFNVEEKYKYDLLAQLLEQTNFSNYFSGINDFIDISWGNPRVFLTILKNVYKNAIYNDEDPFGRGTISIKSQQEGIQDSSKWFYNDAELTGNEGIKVYDSIDRLGQFLRGIRFSDKISQTSPSSFSVKLSTLSDESKKVIDAALDHSFIVEISRGRKNQNSSEIDLLYQINRVLAPKWNLPIARRGVVPFNKEIVDTIFSSTRKDEFDLFYNKYVEKLNAPFTINKVQQADTQWNLF